MPIAKEFKIEVDYSKSFEQMLAEAGYNYMNGILANFLQLQE